MKNMRTLILIMTLMISCSVKAELDYSYFGEWEGSNTSAVGIEYSYFRMEKNGAGVFLFGLSGGSDPVIEKFGINDIIEHEGYIEINVASSPSGFMRKLLVTHLNVGVGIKINYIMLSKENNRVTSKDTFEYSLERKRSPSLGELISNINEIVNKTMKKDAAK